MKNPWNFRDVLDGWSDAAGLPGDLCPGGGKLLTIRTIRPFYFFIS
jgi:hypothetical protein